MVMRYPLADLLAARKFREEAAERDVNQAASALERARLEAAAAREKADEYRLWRPGEEKRLFEKVRFKDLSMNALEEHQEDIQKLRGIELRLEEEAVAASQRVEAARREFARARKVLDTAVKDRKKIDEHRERWLKGEKIRLDMIEESELEDFPAPAPMEEDNGEHMESFEDTP